MLFLVEVNTKYRTNLNELRMKNTTPHALCGQKIPPNPPKPVRDDILDKLHSPQSLASLRVGTRARADLDSGAGRGALQQRKPFLSLTLLQRGPATCARSSSPSS